MTLSSSPFRRVCQIRHIHIPTSCNSRIYGSRFVIQVLQVLYTRMSYFMWLEFPFFATTATQFCSLIPRRLFSVQLSRSSNFAPRAYDCILCVFPFIFESRDSTPLPSINKPPCVPIHTHMYTPYARAVLQATFYGSLNISLANEKLWRSCACTCVKQDEQRRGTCESWRTELRRKFLYDARLKRRIS